MVVGGDNLHIMSMFLTNMYFLCLVIANDNNAIFHPFVSREYRSGTVLTPGLCWWNRLS